MFLTSIPNVHFHDVMVTHQGAPQPRQVGGLGWAHPRLMSLSSTKILNFSNLTSTHRRIDRTSDDCNREKIRHQAILPSRASFNIFLSSKHATFFETVKKSSCKKWVRLKSRAILQFSKVNSTLTCHMTDTYRNNSYDS